MQIVRFIGSIEGKTGEWIGVELAKPIGKNNGDYMGKEYFECPPMHGIFVRPKLIKPFSKEEKAASSIQSLVRMRAGKKKARSKLNWKTWNTLDNRNEQLQLERGKKVRADLGTSLIPEGRIKRRKSIEEAGKYYYISSLCKA